MRAPSLIALLTMACATNGDGEFEATARGLDQAPPPRDSLRITVPPLVLGTPVTFTVSGAAENDRVELIRASRLGFGPCPPQMQGNCLEIVGEPVVVLGGADADATGTAQITVELPPNPAFEGAHFFQAITRQNAADSGDSNESPPAIGFATIPVCPEDGFEPNDLLADAAMISPGVIDGVLCDERTDWYSVSLQPDDIIEVTVDYTGGRLGAGLFDSLMSPIEESRTGSGTEMLAYRNRTAVPEDVFVGLLQTRDFLLPGVPYSLDVVTLQPAPCPADANEDDDVLADASQLPVNRTESLTSCDGDLDLFRLQANNTGVLRTTVTFDPDEGDLAGRILDDQGNELRSFTPIGGTLSLPFPIVTTGTFFVEIEQTFDDDYGGGVPYDISASVGPLDICFEDQFEPNNRGRDAAPITPGTYPSLASCSSDRDDFYSVFVPGGTEITVELDFVNADGNIDLALYQSQPSGAAPNGAVLFTPGLTNGETLSYTPFNDTTVYIGVYLTQDSGGITGGNLYDMTVTLQ